MRKIFVNLPVKDLEASKRFYAGLGFSFNEQFSNEECASVVIEENIAVMLLAERRFRDFITGEISDTAKGKEALFCLSADSRTDVEAFLKRALDHGGRTWMPAQDHGFMYGVSFQDPDGHVWEVMWMDPAAMAAAPEALEAEPA
jgi:hypothetical protein